MIPTEKQQTREEFFKAFGGNWFTTWDSEEDYSKTLFNKEGQPVAKMKLKSKTDRR